MAKRLTITIDLRDEDDPITWEDVRRLVAMYTPSLGTLLVREGLSRPVEADLKFGDLFIDVIDVEPEMEQFAQAVKDYADATIARAFVELQKAADRG